MLAAHLSLRGKDNNDANSSQNDSLGHLPVSSKTTYPYDRLPKTNMAVAAYQPQVNATCSPALVRFRQQNCVGENCAVSLNYYNIILK